MGNQSDLQKNTNQTLGEISDPNTSGSILEVGTEILHPLEDAGIYYRHIQNLAIHIHMFIVQSIYMFKKTW
jgi:hypothetical protein